MLKTLFFSTPYLIGRIKSIMIPKIVEQPVIGTQNFFPSLKFLVCNFIKTDRANLNFAACIKDILKTMFVQLSAVAIFIKKDPAIMEYLLRKKLLLSHG